MLPGLRNREMKKINYDPVSENPLDNEMEHLITMVGERRFLQGVIKDLGVKLNASPDDLTEYECRKVLRAVMRNAKDYRGPEMCQ